MNSMLQNIYEILSNILLLGNPKSQVFYPGLGKQRSIIPLPHPGKEKNNNNDQNHIHSKLLKARTKLLLILVI